MKINSQPTSMSSLLSKYQIKAKETKTMPWQDKALEACKFLVDSTKYKGSIFRCYKKDDHLADISLIDCRELSKPFSRYFLKVFSELNKQV